MSLEKITRVTGRAVPVPGDDIDTDRIIPARYLKCVTFDGLGEYMFYDVRFDPEGNERAHPLNDPRFEDAMILLTGSNFGCGSSREHAPQAIYRAGFRAVVAESFAEIFYGNSLTLGMPCVEATGEQLGRMRRLVDADPTVDVTIDVARQIVTVGDAAFAVTIRDSARSALLEGRWDPLADLLEHRGEVQELAAKLGYVSS